MTPEELEARARSFALRMIKLVGSLPNDPVPRIIGSQMLRSATWVRANYRAARRVQSRATFAAELAVVIEEVDETVDWLELLRDSARTAGRSAQRGVGARGHRDCFSQAGTEVEFVTRFP